MTIFKLIIRCLLRKNHATVNAVWRGKMKNSAVFFAFCHYLTNFATEKTETRNCDMKHLSLFLILFLMLVIAARVLVARLFG